MGINNNESIFLSFTEDDGKFRWESLDVKGYTASGTISKGMSKQILFPGNDKLAAEVRYFEAEPGGYTALERHDHVHSVVILRGTGRVLLGETVREIKPFDTILIPPHTLHQFYADVGCRLGFICTVNTERDRPSRPDEKELEELRNHPVIGDVIKY